MAASLAGYTDATTVSRSLRVDLVAPSSRTWTAPLTLQVGVAITTINPSTTGDSDIAAFSAADLPAGLLIDAQTGAIAGAPTTYSASTATAVVTVTDTAGNQTPSDVPFPAVSKGQQDLSDFAYEASQITFSDSPPALKAPTGAVTTVTYSAAPASVCDVDSSTGALTINGLGTCTITATAPANDNYEQGQEDFVLEVVAIDQLSLNLDAIASDNIVQHRREGGRLHHLRQAPAPKGPRSRSRSAPRS